MTKTKESPLTWTIEAILLEARADLHNGRSPRKWGSVRGGLEIHIQFCETNKFYLGLARAKVFPSIQEWDTTLKFWPETNTSVIEQPHETEDKDKVRKWLVGKLEIDKQLEMM